MWHFLDKCLPPVTMLTLTADLEDKADLNADLKESENITCRNYWSAKSRLRCVF